MTSALYRQVLQDRQDVFNAALAQGVYTPFLLPWDLIPVALLATGVVFAPRLSKNTSLLARWMLTLLTFMYMILRWPYARTCGLSSGYGIGLTGSWGLVMTVVLLLLHNPGTDFRRIEVRKIPRATSEHREQVNGGASPPHDGDLRKRASKPNNEDAQDRRGSSGNNRLLVWQDRPQDFWHLVDWSADLMTSFRGINWNWRVPMKTYAIRPPEGDPPKLSDEAEISNRQAVRQLQRSAITNFLCYYVIIDAIKTIVVTDPYFLGIARLESPSTWPWLIKLTESLPFATKFVRLSLSITSVISALTIIFSLNPLFFGVVLPFLFGDSIYSISKTPLLEAWMYPAQWGSFWESLCSKGLAGMWSTWWHQMFRHGISVPAILLTKKLNIAPRSQLGRFLQLMVAFTMTGCIHAAASSTTFSLVPSKPLNSFFFFMAQSVGILIQTELSRQLNRSMHFPRVVRRLGNFGFVFVFLWYIGPFLSDDFARCQVWLFEPVPVSIFRGLGYGPADCWLPWLQFAKGAKWIGWWNQGYLKGVGIY